MYSTDYLSGIIYATSLLLSMEPACLRWSGLPHRLHRVSRVVRRTRVSDQSQWRAAAAVGRVNGELLYVRTEK